MEKLLMIGLSLIVVLCVAIGVASAESLSDGRVSVVVGQMVGGVK